VTPVVNVHYYIEMDLQFMTDITANLCEQRGTFYELSQTEIGLICFDMYHAFIRIFLERMYVA
jgi:hypothetical protein